MVRKIFSCAMAVFLLLLACPLSGFAENVTRTTGTTGQCTWTLEGTVLTISGNGKMGNYSSFPPNAPWSENITKVVIESGVTSIGDSAFYGCSSLTSITIPDSVTDIGNWAFSGCGGLTSISVSSGNPAYHSSGNCLIDTKEKTLIRGTRTSVIPTDGSVTSIGGSAFSDCSGLTSIIIPDCVTSIGSGAFSGCAGLEELIVADKNPVYHSMNNCIIHTSDKRLVAGCKNSVIPADGSVTRIGDSAFSGCSGLTGIAIPDSVTRIGSAAFLGCSGLTSIIIPDSVTRIDDAAFRECSSLTSATISDSVTKIDYFTFFGCSSLTSITIPDSVTSIDDAAFCGCSALESVTFPDGLTRIGGSVFGGCSALTSITFPDRLTSIGSGAFGGCDSLTSITIPDSVTSVEYMAFGGYNIKELHIAEGSKAVTSTIVVGEYSLEKVTIPGSVTNIDHQAFSDCGFLTSISVSPDNPVYHSSSNCLIDTKGKRLIRGTRTSVIPTDGSVTSIGDEAFSNCSYLESITIPDAVTSIGDGAFSNCYYLRSIVIPDAVTSIGNGAFDGVSSPFTIITKKSSAADDYARSHNIKVKYINEVVPAAPEVKERTANSVTLKATAGYEYRMDDGNWQTSNVFTGLSPDTEYTFYQRIAETDTVSASDSSTGLQVRTALAYIPGNFDEDDIVTEADAIYLLMHTFFPEQYPIAQPCDYDGDGVVTEADAIYLLMYTFFPDQYPIQ